MGDQQIFDRPSRLLAQRRRARGIQSRKKYRELLAAVARNERSFVQSDQRQRFADGTQASIASHVAVPVIEQLEVIDIDHQQCQRTALLGSVLPAALELAIEASSVDKPGQAIQ